jgi:hypothetical protein
MANFTLQELNDFIVRAKATTYVGDGLKLLPSRLGAHDLQYHQPPFAYLDSYFGGSDFLGQEVVYHQAQPIWVMNYYGYILEPSSIDGAQAGRVIKASLSALYREGRFLGGFEHVADGFTYTDTNEGDVRHFTGREWITLGGTKVYELVYHGGLVKA